MRYNNVNVSNTIDILNQTGTDSGSDVSIDKTVPKQSFSFNDDEPDSHRTHSIKMNSNNVPEQISHQINTVTAGSRHTCVVVDGEQKCWGNDDYGQCNKVKEFNSDENSRSPKDINEGDPKAPMLKYSLDADELGYEHQSDEENNDQS